MRRRHRFYEIRSGLNIWGKSSAVRDAPRHRPEQPEQQRHVNLLTNWFEELKRLVPTDP